MFEDERSFGEGTVCKKNAKCDIQTRVLDHWNQGFLSGGESSLPV